MTRPKGFRLNRPALQDILNLKGITSAEGAARAGLSKQMLSSLVHGGGASIKTVQRLAEGIGCDPATLFPELGPFEHVALPDEVEQTDETEAVSA